MGTGGQGESHIGFVLVGEMAAEDVSGVVPPTLGLPTRIEGLGVVVLIGSGRSSQRVYRKRREEGETEDTGSQTC